VSLLWQHQLIEFGELNEKHYTYSSTIKPKPLQTPKTYNGLFVCVINEDKRIGERIESEIAKILHQQGGFIGDFQDKDIRYRPTRPNEQQVRVVMTFPKSIMGLNEELFV
jgi:hypothetical protein